MGPKKKLKIIALYDVAYCYEFVANLVSLKIRVLVEHQKNHNCLRAGEEFAIAYLREIYDQSGHRIYSK